MHEELKVGGDFDVVKVGFADQNFSLELVPLALMADNPHGLDLATPSMAFNMDDLELTREKLISAGIQATEISDAPGVLPFAFPDNEDRWFAVTR